MSKATNAGTFTWASPLAGFGFGVWWFVWGKFGFWWGVVYGLFWPIWFGFLAAARLLQWQ